MSLYEQLLGPDHPNVATVLYMLGTALTRTQRWDEAEQVLRRSLDVAERATPHP